MIEGRRFAKADFFDLPGLRSLELIRSEKNGEGASIKLRFDDWTNIDVPENAPNDVTYWLRPSSSLANKLKEEQAEMIDYTHSGSLREAYFDIIATRLHLAGKLDASSMERSYKNAFDLSPPEAKQRCADMLDVIAELDEHLELRRDQPQRTVRG